MSASACRDTYNEWSNEVKAMADRLMSMRQHLFNALRDKGTAISLSLSLKFIVLAEGLTQLKA